MKTTAVYEMLMAVSCFVLVASSCCFVAVGDVDLCRLWIDSCLHLDVYLSDCCLENLVVCMDEYLEKMKMKMKNVICCCDLNEEEKSYFLAIRTTIKPCSSSFRDFLCVTESSLS
jgi:hypothetical protein